MPGFSDLSADMTRVCFAQLGDAAIFEPLDGGSIALQAEFEERTSVVGDLGQLIDHRPSVKLQREALGTSTRGTLRMLGRVFQLAEAVDGSGDAYTAHFYVREQRDV
ncbi:MAG: hypothetical protein ACREUF_06070 [Solimonas sp.]